jgi:RNA polymerase sigma-70 factor (ECF subfamily)
LTTSDRELLQQAREYDAQALAKIYNRYAEPIYRYLYRYLGDAAQAEDLTSEVFLRLLRVLNTPRAPRDQIQGWLYRVAHNLAMDWFRQQAKGGTLAPNEDLPAEDSSPLAELERRQAQGRLRAAIRELTVDQQRVILLRFGQGCRIAEVSQLMDKSEGAVKILQHRAIRRLRKLLAPEEK